MDYKYRLLTKKEKAKEMGVTTRTIDRWVNSGKLQPIYMTTSSRKYFMKEKNNYIIYIKSHTEAPDYEDETLAYTIEEAAEIFAMRIASSGGEGWDSRELIKYIMKEDYDDN